MDRAVYVATKGTRFEGAAVIGVADTLEKAKAICYGDLEEDEATRQLKWTESTFFGHTWSADADNDHYEYYQIGEFAVR